MTDDQAPQQQSQPAARGKGKIGALIGGGLVLMAGAVVFLLVQMTQVGEDGRPSVGVKKAEATCSEKSPACLPDTDIVDVQGQVFTSEKLRGNVVVINFWATWCRPCLAEIPALSNFYNANKDKGLIMLGLLNETNEVPLEELEAFQKRTKMSFPTVKVDDPLLRAWEYPEALPTTFVYDRDGRLAFKKRGALRESELEREVGKLLAKDGGEGKGDSAGAAELP